MPNSKESRSLAIGLTIVGILGRLLPHAPNVTPVGGSCLFAGARVPGWLAYVLPLSIMLLTDPFLGGYTTGSVLIYASLMINVWLGRRFLVQASPVRVGAVAFLGSFQFFLLSNLMVWAMPLSRGHQSMYTTDLAGLIQTYTMALPFWGRTLVGDLVFTAGFFAIHTFAARRLSRQTQPA